MKLSLGVKLGTSLSLTPQLQQAIRLLQLSTLELEQEIQEQLDSNPLLEIAEEQYVIAQAVEENNNQTEVVDLHEQMQVEVIGGELPVDTQWDDVYTHQSGNLATPDSNDRDFNQSSHETLQEFLLTQVNVLRLSPKDRIIAQCIVDAVDERGYLIAKHDELIEAVEQEAKFVAEHLGMNDELTQEWAQTDAQEINAVLHLLQNLDPAGVCARSLTECLQIQIKQLECDDGLKQAALRVLVHHQYLATQEVAKLAKAAELNVQQLKDAIALIKTLNPHPGQRFDDDREVQQTPDVVVRKKNNRWEVLLNTDNLPKIRVNSYYASMVKRADNSDDNVYLKNNLQEAKNFIKSIDERHKTLLKVATCIVQHQRDFLEQGAEAMKPLVLRDIANETELHESTVSRVTTQKYLLTPRGLFELKYFFSSHVGTLAGGECSSTAIRAMIKNMIKEENPKKPLSDNILAEKLQQEGIDVARRTVAKYRESLNIPSSSERKRLL